MSENREAPREIDPFLWEFESHYRLDMKVPARLYASRQILEAIGDDKSLEQLINMATMPGILGYALAMPDIHQGYGFPIGGVAAFDLKKGVISPGGIGYDINCGVRLLRSEKSLSDVESKLQELAESIFREVPSGVGKTGPVRLSVQEMDRVLEGGAEQVQKMGYGDPQDIAQLESNGVLEQADSSCVSELAKKRGSEQLGTMGGGNHFVEVDVVETIYDADEANRLGLFEGQVTMLIHSGSRGLGHQVATDYIRKMTQEMPKHDIHLPDRALACVPFQSDAGQAYFGAMSAAANYAWANREVITWELREAWRLTLGQQAGPISVVYDVAHNIAKQERYSIGGQERDCIVHRKGASRSFPGQPVLIPGSMGTFSYVLVGQQKAMEVSFGSCCHGAGRRWSRTHARQQTQPEELMNRLQAQGIHVEAGSTRGLTEEAPDAYKDVNEVVDVIDSVGIAKKVVRLKPLCVIKG